MFRHGHCKNTITHLICLQWSTGYTQGFQWHTFLIQCFTLEQDGWVRDFRKLLFKKKNSELTLLMVFIPVEVILWFSGRLLPVSAVVVAFAPNCTTPGLTLSFYTLATCQHPLSQKPWASNSPVEMQRIWRDCPHFHGLGVSAAISRTLCGCGIMGSGAEVTQRSKRG